MKDNTDITTAFFRRCYMCHSPLNREELAKQTPICKKCAELNRDYLEMLLHSNSSLQGRVALVTGGRIKIGFQIALSLLRKGAQVIITTRFPVNAIQRYRAMEDYDKWANHLFIYGIDFRDIREVEKMIEWCYKDFNYLDILINNAAQTVSRPKEYYLHLNDLEKAEKNLLPETEKKKLVNSTYSLSSQAKESSKIAKFFPAGIVDEEGLQIDLRHSNSWISRAWDVSTKEMLEVQLVNVTAPFLFCSKFVELMKKSPFQHKFIVNVSSMEGRFSKPNKNGFHPHTNMAKAALNMLTRTIAEDYKKIDIYVNSVDTGWITDENPFWIRKKNKTKGVIPPLSCEDGAARVCAPIFTFTEDGKEPSYGKFLKDFKIIQW